MFLFEKVIYKVTYHFSWWWWPVIRLNSSEFSLVL